MNTFARTVDMMHRGLDATTVRRQVISNNLTNADVPNFKRSDVNFESELKRAVESERRRPLLEMKQTHEKHFPNWREKDYRDVQVRRVLDYTTQYDNNGNNVDPEYEIMLLTQNQMTYNLFVQAVSFEFGQLNRILRS